MRASRRAIEMLAGLLFSGLVAGASSQSWVVRLDDSHLTRTADQPLRLRLPDNMPAEARSALLYKLDDADVTDSVTSYDKNTRILPAQSLTPGRHRLVLLHAPKRGPWRELGVWAFSVVEKHAPNNTDSPRIVSTLVGENTHLDVKFAKPKQPAAAQWDVFAAPAPSPAPDAWDTTDLASDDYTATLRSGNLALQMGKQKLPFQSLIHKDQERTGTSAEWSLGKRSRIRSFDLRTAQRSHVNGMLLEHQNPIQGSDGVHLRGGWVSGESNTANSNSSAWSMAGDASLLAQRLKLRLEYAHSQSAVKNADVDSLTGAAYTLAAEWRSDPGADLVWRLGTEHTRINHGFKSLANPGLASDRLKLRTYADLSIREWRLDWSHEQWRNNLEGLAQLSTLKTEKSHLAAAWKPADVFGLAFFGKPSYKLSADYGQVRELAAPAVLDHHLPDRRSLDMVLQTEFAHPDWRWGIKARHGQLQHTDDTAADTQSVAVDLHGDFSAMTRLPAKPLLSWQRKVRPASGVVAQKWAAKMKTPTLELRKNLRASVNLELARWVQSDLNDDTNALSFGGSMVWTLQRPNQDRQGLALTLSGKIRDGDVNSSSIDENDYQFMVSLSTANPLDAW